MVMLLLVTLPMGSSESAVWGVRDWLCPKKNLARKDRVYQRKSPVITVSHCSQLFFYLQHPIIEPHAKHVHYISCIYGGWLL